MYFCEDCAFSFSNRDAWEEHLLTVHSNDEPDSSPTEEPHDSDADSGVANGDVEETEEEIPVEKCASVDTEFLSRLRKHPSKVHLSRDPVLRLTCRNSPQDLPDPSECDFTWGQTPLTVDDYVENPDFYVVQYVSLGSSCPKCGKFFSDESRMETHMPRCNFEAKRERVVVATLSRSSKTASSSFITCPSCRIRYLKRSFIQHLRTAHEAVNEMEASKASVRCQIPGCDKVLGKRFSHAEHLLLHPRSKDFACKSCPSNFCTLQSLLRHYLTHEQEFSGLKTRKKEGPVRTFIREPSGKFAKTPLPRVRKKSSQKLTASAASSKVSTVKSPVVKSSPKPTKKSRIPSVGTQPKKTKISAKRKSPAASPAQAEREMEAVIEDETVLRNSCKHCGKHFASRSNRIRHEALHFSDGQYRDVINHGKSGGPGLSGPRLSKEPAKSGKKVPKQAKISTPSVLQDSVADEKLIGKCRYCFRAVDKPDLIRHEASHWDKGVFRSEVPLRQVEARTAALTQSSFKCALCKKEFPTMFYLQKHKRDKHGKRRNATTKKAKSPKKKRTKDVETLEPLEMEDESPKLVLRSPVKEKIEEKAKSKEPVDQKVSKEPKLAIFDPISTFDPSSSLYTCLECKKHFSDPTMLTEHVIKFHSRTFVARCSLCSVGFLSQATRQIHEASCVGDSEKNLKIHCRLCDLSFPTKPAFVHHVHESHSDLENAADDVLRGVVKGKVVFPAVGMTVAEPAKKSRRTKSASSASSAISADDVFEFNGASAKGGGQRKSGSAMTFVCVCGFRGTKTQQQSHRKKEHPSTKKNQRLARPVSDEEMEEIQQSPAKKQRLDSSSSATKKRVSKTKSSPLQSPRQTPAVDPEMAPVQFLKCTICGHLTFASLMQQHHQEAHGSKKKKKRVSTLKRKSVGSRSRKRSLSSPKKMPDEDKVLQTSLHMNSETGQQTLMRLVDGSEVPMSKRLGLRTKMQCPMCPEMFDTSILWHRHVLRNHCLDVCLKTWGVKNVSLTASSEPSPMENRPTKANENESAFEEESEEMVDEASEDADEESVPKDISGKKVIPRTIEQSDQTQVSMTNNNTSHLETSLESVTESDKSAAAARDSLNTTLGDARPRRPIQASRRLLDADFDNMPNMRTHKKRSISPLKPQSARRTSDAAAKKKRPNKRSTKFSSSKRSKSIPEISVAIEPENFDSTRLEDEDDDDFVADSLISNGVRLGSDNKVDEEYPPKSAAIPAYQQKKFAEVPPPSQPVFRVRVKQCVSMAEQVAMLQEAESQLDSPVSRLTCSECPELSFDTPSLFYEHFSGNHRVTEPVTCSICKSSSKNLQALRNHVRRLHADIFPLKCPECPKVFSRGRGLDMHMELVHRSSAGGKVEQLKSEKGKTREKKDQKIDPVGTLLSEEMGIDESDPEDFPEAIQSALTLD
ncbi:unnamed protein product [Notodromas monacha]|uniref:C2H2-type domain-containing protein n=1 Tax=Notodromas monacha TaxID=399045 RepID=A0A7R9BU56_9CRUS|nr:unnamed protein product [Notodromas monacha]CAG0920790.1 unnamed protein product [Notodromas monacha]